MFLCWVLLYVFVGKIKNHYTPKIEHFAFENSAVRPPKGKEKGSSSSRPIIFQGLLLFNFGGVSSPLLDVGMMVPGTVSWDAPSNFIEAWRPGAGTAEIFPQATRVFKMDANGYL